MSTCPHKRTYSVEVCRDCGEEVSAKPPTPPPVQRAGTCMVPGAMLKATAQCQCAWCQRFRDEENRASSRG